MKEANWEDCISSQNAIRMSPDKEKAKSLIEIAEERIKFTAQKMTENNANFLFEDYYSSIIELIHSITILSGYKISNHICLGYYLKDTLKKENLFRIFDDLRYKRNLLTYYGQKMDFETAKDTIEKSKKLISELREIIKKNYQI